MRSQSLLLALRGASSLTASTSSSSSSTVSAAAIAASGLRRYHKNVSEKEREIAVVDVRLSFV